MTNTDQRVRLHAARAAGVLGSKYLRITLPGLLDMLRSRELPEVVMACWALGEMGDPGEQAYKALKDLADNKDADDLVRAAAEEALKRLKKK
jgi:HEAT repeat protein